MNKKRTGVMEFMKKQNEIPCVIDRLKHFNEMLPDEDYNPTNEDIKKYIKRYEESLTIQAVSPEYTHEKIRIY